MNEDGKLLTEAYNPYYKYTEEVNTEQLSCKTFAKLIINRLMIRLKYYIVRQLRLIKKIERKDITFRTSFSKILYIWLFG
jgi:hypothetical protein